MLSDADSESDTGGDHLLVNEHYQKALQARKDREELRNLKAKYGPDVQGSDSGSGESGDETDSDSDYSEDEDGEELTPAVDAAILRTMAKIKRKDPEIYESDKKVYQNEHGKIHNVPTLRAKSAIKPTKGLSVRDAALREVLDGSTSRSPSPSQTYAQGQATLRDDTIAAFHQADPANDLDDDDDLLVARAKTKDELELEEDDYRAFLEREVGQDIQELVSIESAQAEAGPSVQKKSKKPKVKDTQTKGEEDREFLMNYIFNRGWIDRDAKRVPTYKEITSNGKSKSQAQGADSDFENGNDEVLDSDEFDDVVDDFESSYNFRFEEPDADKIKTFPRILPSTVRREETTRKDARERKKLRKEERKQQKKEDIKRLKALKMHELRDKLAMIGKEGGLAEEDPALQGFDLEAEWDPDQHDVQMAGLYGGRLDEENDTEKPNWDDELDLGDIIVEEDEEDREQIKKSKKRKKKERDEMEGVDMDAMDAELDQPEDEWDGTEEMRKRLVKEYMDEIDALGFNDMVGDLPTRFHYAPVEAEDFSLTPSEILLATDQELNEYRSIKKYAPYRRGNTKWDPKKGEKLKELKGKVSGRAPEGWLPQHTSGAVVEKKRMGKKERQKKAAAASTGGSGQQARTESNPKRKREDVTSEVVEEDSKKKRKRHKKTKAEGTSMET